MAHTLFLPLLPHRFLSLEVRHLIWTSHLELSAHAFAHCSVVGFCVNAHVLREEASQISMYGSTCVGACHFESFYNCVSLAE